MSAVSSAKRGARRATVSRGGRAELAEDALRDVDVPTLLIVGGRDAAVIDSTARRSKRSAHAPGSDPPRATHLFEEPGALDEVARLAGDWFLGHLTSESGP